MLVIPLILGGEKGGVRGFATFPVLHAHPLLPSLPLRSRLVLFSGLLFPGKNSLLHSTYGQLTFNCDIAVYDGPFMMFPAGVKDGSLPSLISVNGHARQSIYKCAAGMN